MNWLPKVILSTFLVLITLSLFAQKGTYKTAATIGITTPLLDNGTGFHIAINPIYGIGSHIALEGQVAYGNAKITGSFLSGNQGKLISFNALAGARAYLLSPEKNTRPYLNLLVGGVRLLETRDNQPAGNPDYFFGFSVGAHVEISKFMVGLSYENFGLVILKAGYHF